VTFITKARRILTEPGNTDLANCELWSRSIKNPIAYVIHATYWNCMTFPVHSQVRGRLTRAGNNPQVELMYYSKGKLKSNSYVVDSQAAIP